MTLPAHTLASTSITVENLTKVFGSGASAARAVDGISLKIEPGELFFLLGPSGCGKTTLLRMIAGFIDPTSGTILFNNRDVTHAAPEKRNTGMVFQSYALWPHMTVAQNVAFGLNVRKIKGDERDRRVKEALAAVQMDVYAERKPNQLSGGQQQRVALARALVVRPDVLLLDEPLSNLDAKLRLELRSEIRRICKDSGITTVYVTHDQKEALSMADRVAILRSGKIVQVGSPEELYRGPKDRFVAEFLGETNLFHAELKLSTEGQFELVSEAGRLKALPREGQKPGVSVLCSVRPEAARLVEPGRSNTLSGKYLDTMYLGEIAQHTVSLPTKAGSMELKIAELNPRGTSALCKPGAAVGVAVDPADLVVLPAE